MYEEPNFIAALMASRDQDLLMASRKPEVARDCRSGVAGWEDKDGGTAVV